MASQFAIDLVPRSAVDAPALVALINRAYERYEVLQAPRISLEGFLGESRPESEFFLAREAGRLVGCAMIDPADRFYAAVAEAPVTGADGAGLDCARPQPLLGGFPVVPRATVPFQGDLADALYFGLAAADRSHQDRGVGTALLAAAESTAAARGYRRVVLTTIAEFGLRDYYQSFGYGLAGSERYQAGHWAISVPHDYCYMEKVL